MAAVAHAEPRQSNKYVRHMFCRIKARCGHTYSTAVSDTDVSTCLSEHRHKLVSIPETCSRGQDRDVSAGMCNPKWLSNF